MKCCHYCSDEKADLRPYGPNGAYVCFKCAMATPEREKQTGAMFMSQLDAAAKAGNGLISFGTDAGPVPMMGKELH